MNKLKTTGQFFKTLITLSIGVLFFGYNVQSQILHDVTCGSNSTNFSLDWDETPSASQFNWGANGTTTFTASNIQGSGNNITFSVTGATGTLATEGGKATPSINTSLSGGADAVHISSSGLTAGQEMVLTMTFAPALAGNIAFDLYNIRQLVSGGAGQQLEIFGLTSTGFALVPELTDNGTPSWELEGPGVIDGNIASNAGTNDQVGINFKSISDISTITIILRRCADCGTAANTEFALGDIDICLTPDTDQDGISDTNDADDDNDGILDVVEKCPVSPRSLADWDNYTYNNGDVSNTYALPEGTNMKVSVSSNGASIVTGETNTNITGGQGAGTVGLFLNGNQNLQVNSIDVSFKWDQAIDGLQYTIFDLDQLGGQYVDSVTIIGFYDGFVVFPALTGSANNTATTNRASGDASTNDALATANLGVAFSEPIDSMVIFYGNASTAPSAPGNQWITIWDLSYIGDCGSTDSDGDGVPDYLDIDADNDGIVDYIEWQGSTATPITPAGADADADGIDDNFESAATPVDTDGDGIPDFQDPDTDNDGDLDELEAWDTSNNGTANTLSQSTDPDGDGLDGLANGTGFDDQNGWNPTTNITNSNQTSSFFPNLDNAGTSERDWREDNDFDGDGIQNYADIDDDNDGILDVNEGSGTNNPNGDEDGDGIQNWSDATDNGNGGDGSISDYTDTNSDGIPDVFDVDFDGQPNHLDLDSDGDGIADIVEAGGVDTDGNGIVDGAFTDTDGDGWSNTFDSDNGGTALTDVDQDGDNKQNHLDIDADDDGIPDLIESQPSGALNSPSGIDADEDGIDNNFDADFSGANRLTDPVNTDVTDNADYLDANSDNDVDSDLIEGWDTNNDGAANTSPSGADADNDGLDDNFDNYDLLVLQNYATNATDNGKTSASFPDLDTPGGELDWRDINNVNDNDGDGVTNDDDVDDDNDGILDVDEGACAEEGEVVNVTAAGIGSYTVLSNGQVTLSMNGGDGGGGSSTAGGSGATITNAVFNVTSGDVIRYVVGGGSLGSTGGGVAGAGGSGSTGLFINNDLVMVAGGGAGGDNSGGAIGFGASSGVNGVSGNGGDFGVGGTGNQGAITGTGGTSGGGTNTGGGGGGITGDGTTGADGGLQADMIPADGVTLQAGGTANGNTGNTAGAAGFTSGGGAGGNAYGGGGGGFAGGGASGIGGSAGGGGSFINTGLASYVSGSITAGVNAAGGAANTNGTDGFVTISIACTIAGIDTDNDGVQDFYDLDSDGDGIADIVEAGGVDADGNGSVDGVFTDTDGDGWSNTFDSDNGGTALTDADADADGLENRIDIDSDNDGILDIIESQPSGTLIIPSGTDSDGDGIDDNFDPNSGNTLIDPENTDGTDNPDYTDTDTDNDGDLDVLEGWDTDNDGVADVTPTGTDTDNDGLDEGYDNVVGPNNTTNVTDNGKDSDFYPDLDRAATPERDWRENKDFDSDGIADDIDIDDDNDGVLDADEAPCAAPSIRFKADPDAYWTLDNTTDDATANNNDERSDGNAPGFSTDAIQGTHSANFNGTSNQIRYSQDGGFMESTYTDVSFSAWIRPTALVGDRVIYEEGGATNGLILWLDDGLLTYTARNGGAGSETSVSVDASRTLGIDNLWHHVAATFEDGVMTVYLDGISETVTAGFIQISNHGSDGGLGGPHGGTTNGVTGNFAGLMDAARYSNTEAWSASRIGFEAQRFCDTDNDGIADHLDLDSDNDGVADILEAGGIDADGNGSVDGGFTDTDGDGWSNTFDSDNGGTSLADTDSDGDGFENRIDIDADGDGIIDIVESQPSGTLIIPSGSDVDGDGIDDNFDPDSGNSLTTPENTDGIDTPDYTDTDSDNDGDLDILEGWDTDNDGTANTSPAAADADNDGLDDNYDNIVGPNNTTNVTDNGKSSFSYPNLDKATTTDPDWREVLDNDNDGISDVDDLDDDNDGIPDLIENPGFDADGDGDGVPAYLDDDDTDGGTGNVDGNVEPGFDADGDGVADFFDVDSDNDGIPDIVEAGGEDTDGNGLVDDINANGTLTTDTDTDGLADVYDATNGGTAILHTDTDGDGINDSQDLDADNDGIPDVVEAGGTDVNGDGRADNYTDADGDGFNDTVDGDPNQDGTSNNSANALTITGDDTDADGVPNSYPNDDNDGDGIRNQLDLDADNDGIPDVVEAGGTDENGDGRIDDYLDADNDGFNDVVDGDPTNALTVGTDTPGANSSNSLVLTGPDLNNDGAPNSSPSGDFDQDGAYNFLDLDADGDGILDVLEAGGTDTNTDGLEDSFTDSDTDGFNDNVDGDPDNSLAVGDDTNDSNTSNSTTLTGPDSDADGKPNSFPNDDFDGDTKVDFLDIDTDNDGIVDNTEAQSTAGYLSPTNIDVDGDGIDSRYDSNDGSFGGAGSGLTPVDTDVAVEPNSPDYRDVDSENDGISDLIEGHDTDGDELADAGSLSNTGVPGGITDIDNDGLLDGFDNNTASTDATNGSLQGVSHPNITNPTTAERDWREISDRDNDGLSDAQDIDDDNDGILDENECASTPKQKIVFNYTGADQTYNVPPTATEIRAKIWGAGGRGDEIPGRGVGGAGGYTEITIPVSSLTSLTLILTVGEGGNSTITGARPYGNGGIASTGTSNGPIRNFGSGGGMSAISYSTLANPAVLTNSSLVAIAGGGGTMPAFSNPGTKAGDGGGTAGSNATDGNAGINGLGGNQVAGGGSTNGNDGAFLLGGNSRENGGSGGGGYYGGGSGSFLNPEEGGGGAGSAFISNTTRYGQTLRSTVVQVPPRDTDPDYIAGIGRGGNSNKGNGGNGLIIIEAIYLNCDEDGDGITNQFDLDSDGDGLPDLIEAGGADTDNDGKVDGYVDTDGDGWANTFDPNDGGTPLLDEDKDGDGFKNRIDLDSDDDGLQDILETGGVDADGDGKGDSGADTDDDGWSNLFDSDDGGTALPVPDTDGDGTLPNYLDVDSDNDGIIDNIEWQTTANFNVLSNVDANNNGWDDEYDGNVEAISNLDVAADAIPDYLDLNTDDDTQPDWLERADDDEDGDALLDLISIPDAYELANGNPNQYVSSDDADSDGIPDFLEDANSDGVPNFLDPGNVMYYFDTDNDGLVDLYDADQNGDNRDNVSEMGEADNDGSPDFRDEDDEVSLPIELISFVVSKVGAYVQLDWSTATEINNDYFTVERSQDGQTFEEILTEKGAGNSSRRLDYRRYDESPELGHNYYRLSQTDFNGVMETFNVEVVNFDGSTLFDNEPSVEMKVYPNPTEGSRLTLIVSKLEAGEVALEIMTAEGQLISQQQLSVDAEKINYEIEILQGKKLASGTYYLRVITRENAAVISFIVKQ
jgi:hypothetical protein